MESFDCRFKFRDLAVAPYFRQSASANSDNQWAGQPARCGEVVFAQRIENLVNGRTFPAGARFHPFTHINGRRDRRALILPMTAAQGVRLCRKIPRTFSSFASGTHKSNPPLVCASVNTMRCGSSVITTHTALFCRTRA